MSYVLIVHATFNSQADAQDAYDQIRARAQNASVARIGEPGERTSHSYLKDETADSILARWHIDDFGILRDGAPDSSSPPAWIQPTGSQDAYPALNVYGNPARVSHNGSVWENTHGDGNTWEPGAFGWTEVA